MEKCFSGALHKEDPKKSAIRVRFGLDTQPWGQAGVMLGMDGEGRRSSEGKDWEGSRGWLFRGKVGLLGRAVRARWGVDDAGSGWRQPALLRTARKRDPGGLESLKPQPLALRVCLPQKRSPLQKRQAVSSSKTGAVSTGKPPEQGICEISRGPCLSAERKAETACEGD